MDLLDDSAYFLHWYEVATAAHLVELVLFLLLQLLSYYHYFGYSLMLVLLEVLVIVRLQDLILTFGYLPISMLTLDFLVSWEVLLKYEPLVHGLLVFCHHRFHY